MPTDWLPVYVREWLQHQLDGILFTLDEFFFVLDFHLPFVQW